VVLNKGKVQLKSEGKNIIAECCTALEILKSKCDGDKELFDKIALAYDVIHASPAKTDNRAAALENAAMETVRKLSAPGMSKTDTLNALDKLIAVFNERNIVLKNRG